LITCANLLHPLNKILFLKRTALKEKFMTLQITSTFGCGHREDVTIARLDGYATRDSGQGAEKLAQYLQNMSRGTKLILDMGGMIAFDIFGFRAIVEARETILSNGGAFALVGCKSHPSSTFRLAAGFEPELAMHDSVEDALNYLENPPPELLPAPSLSTPTP
jgi:anti-anti-sigma regulatory factor